MKRKTVRIIFSASIWLGMMLCISSLHAGSDFQVDKVVISKHVANRNPAGIFSPSAYCEKDKNGQAAIPVVKSSQTSKVFFWTKVIAVAKGTLRHSWHHQINGTWTKVSVVNLSIRPSPGYRMWSLKTIKPEVHTGEWMIVVAPSNAPEEILCITRFRIE